MVQENYGAASDDERRRAIKSAPEVMHEYNACTTDYETERNGIRSVVNFLFRRCILRMENAACLL